MDSLKRIFWERLINMSLTPIEKYTVKTTLEMTNASMFLSYFLTIWKGIPLIACFNNLSNSIDSVTCSVQLTSKDFNWLEDTIMWYHSNNEEIEEQEEMRIIRKKEEMRIIREQEEEND